MFLNDRYGDCTCAALRAHGASPLRARRPPEHRPDDAIFELYHQTGVEQHLGDDDGRYMEGVLSYLKRVGLRQTAGDSNNPAGTSRRSSGTPPSTRSNSPRSRGRLPVRRPLRRRRAAEVGDHADERPQVVVRRRQRARVVGRPRGDVTAVNSDRPRVATWAMRQQMTWAWWKHYVDEAVRGRH
jgi:hypothetical protein